MALARCWLVLAGWAALITVVFGDISLMTDTINPVLWVLQIVGAIVFVGAVGIAAWNVWLTWRDGRRWTRKLWSVLVLLSALVVLYTAATYSLLAMTVDF